MRTVLVGAVESTRVALEVLGEQGDPPAAVLTLPVSRAARHSDFADLRRPAAQLGVPVIEIVDVNAPTVLEQVRTLEPTYALVIGWSQICRREFLEIPSGGAIGAHPAPLPENRGRAVIPWTILQGRRETGTTLFWLDEGADSGDILLQERFAIAPGETAATLYAKHAAALHRMLAAAVPRLRDGTAPRLPQDHTRATYCAQRTPADGWIDWERAAASVWTLIRAVGDPYPGAFSFHRGKRLFVWEADLAGDAPYTGLPGQVQAVLDSGALVQCGDGQHLLLKTVQPEGETRMPAQCVLRNHDRVGVDWLDVLRRALGNGSP